MRISDWSSDVCSSDLVVDLLVPEVALHADAGRLQPVDHLKRIGIGVGHDGRHHRLHRREPERQPACEMLDQYADEPLIRSEEHTSETPVTNAHIVCRLLLEKKKQNHKKHKQTRI